MSEAFFNIVLNLVRTLPHFFTLVEEAEAVLRYDGVRQHQLAPSVHLTLHEIRKRLGLVLKIAFVIIFQCALFLSSLGLGL